MTWKSSPSSGGHTGRVLFSNVPVVTSEGTLTRNVISQISGFDIGDNRSLLQRVVIITDAVDGLITSFAEAMRPFSFTCTDYTEKVPFCVHGDKRY